MSNIFQLFQASTLRRNGRVGLLIAEWFMRVFSASVEIYLRRNFGRRYLPTLVIATVFYVFNVGFVAHPTQWSTTFALGLFMFTIGHCALAIRRRGCRVPEPHSYSAGESWNFWQRWRLQKSTVQRYIEPSICLMVGVLLSGVDPFLSFWLKASGVSLFTKEQFNRLKITRRILDAADGRIEAQRLNTGLSNYVSRPNQAVQQSHRARFPHQPPRRS